jgi:hypothetical protein
MFPERYVLSKLTGDTEGSHGRENRSGSRKRESSYTAQTCTRAAP